MTAWVKANPGKATVGAVGVGGPTDMRRLSSSRSAPAPASSWCPIAAARRSIQDLVAGQIDLTVRPGQRTTWRTCAAAGSRPSPSYAKQRWWAAPDVPTMERGGRARLLHRRSGTGSGCRRARRRTWLPSSMRAVVDALADPALRKRLQPRSVRNLAARTANAGGARRPAKSRDRAVVADHQGRQHQGASERIANGGGE